MNGAAVNCQQEQDLHPQHNDSSSLHSPGYLHQTNYPCQENNSQHQYSKEMNYKLLPDNFSVDGPSRHSQYIDSYSSEPRNRLSNSGDIWDSRINAARIIREPMELPVPTFEIDENSVGVFTYKKDKSSLVQNSKDLDLDTRIDLLIKSKALSGMHPIFSDLNESEDSSYDSEDSYKSSKVQPSRHDKIPEKHVLHQESFDDPEKPLSRPPSPFLSRATYLFWFNKAIELKQLAKAQEQALLEQATKKLNQGNLLTSVGGKENKTSNSKQDNNLLTNLLSEVSKELKESIKQDFIKEIIENTVLNSLEDWWVKERQLEEDNSTKDLSTINSIANDNLKSKGKTEKTKPAKFQAKTDIEMSKDQKATSPKVLVPSRENKKQKSKEEVNICENQVTSIIESNTTLVKRSEADVLEEVTAGQGSVLSKENNYSSTTITNENCLVGGSSFRESNPLIPEETKSSTNDTDNTLDMRRNNASNNENSVEKSNKKLLQDLKTVNNEETNNQQHSPMVEILTVPGTLCVKSLKENILVGKEEGESAEHSFIGSVKALDALENLEESGVSSKEQSVEKDKKEENLQQDLINNKENNAETKQNDNQ